MAHRLFGGFRMRLRLGFHARRNRRDIRFNLIGRPQGRAHRRVQLNPGGLEHRFHIGTCCRSRVNPRQSLTHGLCEGFAPPLHTAADQAAQRARCTDKTCQR
jgi:hypothetical protein